MSVVDKMSRSLSSYGRMNTSPAAVSAVFAALSLYQFGAIDAITWQWGGPATLEPSWTVAGSLLCWLFAFMSSETTSLEHYEDVEIGTMLSAVVVSLGWNLTPPSWIAANVPAVGQTLSDFLLGLGDPLAGMLAFGTVLTGWVVATQ
jgi:hypothetical protein